ncbi:mechanosensitive ion channel protein MscS [Weizmannia acidilactici]|uniref:Mechanosensitive ion channel protein MscS n=1 Tax=Weizmannia acidilactici TaxID=2607726 RepID=A0A5J4JF18_9BACI|nr:mechanosensitive ion channel family protein [Weizmannia acidilactici]GER67312.1 mechanosensitive ion channel protein MscS [Weizmannia acidilactici]GER70029.1 mechanosensitive ion channel protein MscS [Weizmannia acidilactici]GER74623.1 mechanosensitive ion channel protein MscS [Weizmannia acidilactici]
MRHFEAYLKHLEAKWLNEDTWVKIGETALKIVLVLLVASLIIKFGKKAIRKVFEVRAKAPLRFTERREATLLRLMENTLTYLVGFIAIVTVLSLLGINVQGLLAGAGIVGLAVGFGAQSLVKDIISGFFIIFEDQFSVGDTVQIGKFQGVVEEIGLRTTKIKNWTGELYIIPNGNISEVTNYSIHNSVAVVDVHIPYEENIDKAEAVIQELLSSFAGQYEEIVSEPELLGVQQLGTTDVTLRVVAETIPMEHWYIARVLKKEIKKALDENHIHAPYPKMITYSRTEEEQALNSQFLKGDEHGR